MTCFFRSFRCWGAAVALLAMAVWPAGCRWMPRRHIEPVSIANPSLGPITIAVAPALNLSGSTEFDPNSFADLMASELDHADGVSVIAVSRVLGVMAAQGVEGVRSPAHALELVKLLGADAILVFAISEYDPYDPPSIGIAAQLYGTRPGPGGGGLDPVALSRKTSLAGQRGGPSVRGLLAQTQRVFNASHKSVVGKIRRFAATRDGEESPYGWRKYVVSQRGFIRFCCHETIETLLTAARGDGNTSSAGK